MARTIFVGRDNFKRDFSEFLMRMASDGKESRLFPQFRKKKEEEDIYPRIFLLLGGPGAGKSAMAAQWAGMARGMGSEMKKPILTVTLDCEEIVSKNLMMLHTLIEALHRAFSPEGHGDKEYFSEYDLLQRGVGLVHEKVEQLCKREWSPDAQKRTERANVAGGVSLDGANGDPGEEIPEDRAFTDWLRGNGKLPEDELDLYENSDFRLSKALVAGIVRLSSENPVVLTIDGFHHFHNKEIEEWMRNVFLRELFKRKNKVMVVISGRGDILRNFRNNFAETLLYVINFDDYPLTRYNIGECARAYQAQLSEEELGEVEETSGGTPFIVRNILGLVKDKVPLRLVLEASELSLEATQRMPFFEIRRFLTYCPNKVVKKKIIHCSLMRRVDCAVLAKLWDMSFTDAAGLIEDFAAHYPFIRIAENSGRCLAAFRDYLIKEKSSGNDFEVSAIIDEFGAAVSSLMAVQLAQLRADIGPVEKRYDDERFTETLLEYVNTLLWNNRDELFAMLPGIFLECLQYNGAFTVRLLQCIDEFRILLTTQQAAMIDSLINGVLSAHPMSMWLGIEPSVEETAMLQMVEDNAGNCSELQLALLHCRQGELFYRLGEYDQAYQKFGTCLPRAQDSESLMKNLIDDYCSLGGNLFSAGNNEAAVRVFQLVTTHRPENYEAWYTLGRAQTALGQTGESTVSYVKTLELRPDNADAWYRLGLAYHALHSHPQAVESLSNALGLDAGNAHAWHTLGRAYSALGRYEEAARSLTKSVEIEPGDKETWFERGSAHAALQWFQEAIPSFEKAVALDGKLHPAWYALGQANYRLGFYSKAIAAFTAALEIAPGIKEYLFNMALACHGAEDYGRAVSYWGKVLELDPSDNAALYQMALSLHAQGQYGDALQLYKQAASAMPGNVAVLLNMGRVYHAMSLFNDAIDMYRKALQINPDEPEVWDDMGVVFTGMRLYGDAIQAYKELTRIAPTWEHAWSQLGHTYYLIRHYEDALQSFTKAVELNSRDCNAWGSLGLTHFALGAYDEAMEADARALAIKPDESWIRANLALSTLLWGNIEGARTEYENLISLASSRDDMALAATALEEVLTQSPRFAQAGDILAKLKGVVEDA
jgi:tetratricopeptide (TPR) repeat protein